jgi:hypothetical protein
MSSHTFGSYSTGYRATPAWQLKDQFLVKANGVYNFLEKHLCGVGPI